MAELAAHTFNTGLIVNSQHTRYTKSHIISEHTYSRNHIEKTQDGIVHVKPSHYKYIFKTNKTPQRTGVMIVGLGGSNATTFVATQLANKHSMTWQARNNTTLHSNWYGSLTQSTTMRVGSNNEAKDVHIPFSSILPMISPDSIVVSGWDIHGANLGEAMRSQGLFDPQLQQQLYPLMKDITPLKSIYYPDFINENQRENADNVLPASWTKKDHLKQLRQDIRQFKAANNLQQVIIVYSASTERYSNIHGCNMTAEQLLGSISQNDSELSPSTMFAVAAILENAPFVNTASQNTFVPGVIDLASRRNVFLVGDDLKSGQTKTKSVLIDYLVSSGLKLQSAVSYNNLGNNDGKNLASRDQQAAKKYTRTNITDDMAAMNGILYPNNDDAHNKIDHRTTVRYVPYVGDDKRSNEEYTSLIAMNQPHTMVIFTTASDSFLAAPLLLDLVILVELFTRIVINTNSGSSWHSLEPLLGNLLGYFLKSPNNMPGTPVTHALTKQQRTLTNFLFMCAGLVIDADMRMEAVTKLPKPLPISASL